jgi:formate dehydrogenase subunit gamma
MNHLKQSVKKRKRILMSSKMIKRHTKTTIFMHWFNAFCWFFLLATGLGLVKNPDLQLMGGWWSNLMYSIFGSGETLLLAHEICGLTWLGVFILYGIFGLKDTIAPFLKQILSYSPSRDLTWLIKKNIQMTLGYTWLKRLGFAPDIPDQGFYNVGQKLFAVASILGGIVIAVTGLIMFLSNLLLSNTVIVQWAIVIHFVAVGVVTGGLLIHIYMAAISSDERPAFFSMFTGEVPEDYAEHHHKLWYDELKNAEREVQSA